VAGKEAELADAADSTAKTNPTPHQSNLKREISTLDLTLFYVAVISGCGD
jgi:hypothetical protein